MLARRDSESRPVDPVQSKTRSGSVGTGLAGPSAPHRPPADPVAEGARPGSDAQTLATSTTAITTTQTARPDIIRYFALVSV